jgi:hypothetical protein
MIFKIAAGIQLAADPKAIEIADVRPKAKLWARELFC